MQNKIQDLDFLHKQYLFINIIYNIYYKTLLYFIFKKKIYENKTNTGYYIYNVFFPLYTLYKYKPV